MSLPWRRAPREEVVKNAETASMADVAFNMTRKGRNVAERRVTTRLGRTKVNEGNYAGKSGDEGQAKDCRVVKAEGVK